MVGVHFVPLAVIFLDPGLIVLAVLTVAGSILAVVLHRRHRIAPSAITALSGGVPLLIFAARAAVITAF